MVRVWDGLHLLWCHTRNNILWSKMLYLIEPEDVFEEAEKRALQASTSVFVSHARKYKENEDVHRGNWSPFSACILETWSNGQNNVEEEALTKSAVRFRHGRTWIARIMKYSKKPKSCSSFRPKPDVGILNVYGLISNIARFVECWVFDELVSREGAAVPRVVRSLFIKLKYSVRASKLFGTYVSWKRRVLHDWYFANIASGSVLWVIRSSTIEWFLKDW